MRPGSPTPGFPFRGSNLSRKKYETELWDCSLPTQLGEMYPFCLWLGGRKLNWTRPASCYQTKDSVNPHLSIECGDFSLFCGTHTLNLTAFLHWSEKYFHTLKQYILQKGVMVLSINTLRKGGRFQCGTCKKHNLPFHSEKSLSTFDSSSFKSLVRIAL